MAQAEAELVEGLSGRLIIDQGLPLGSGQVVLLLEIENRCQIHTCPVGPGLGLQHPAILSDRLIQLAVLYHRVC